MTQPPSQLSVPDFGGSDSIPRTQGKKAPSVDQTGDCPEGGYVSEHFSKITNMIIMYPAKSRHLIPV